GRDEPEGKPKAQGKAREEVLHRFSLENDVRRRPWPVNGPGQYGICRSPPRNSSMNPGQGLATRPDQPAPQRPPLIVVAIGAPHAQLDASSLRVAGEQPDLLGTQ